ncbi:MAG: hypothetical protein M3262_04105, partial [Actinomycetota bacterium]|nr:hypothetical protein [Actinomycetota bacterium]
LRGGDVLELEIDRRAVGVAPIDDVDVGDVRLVLKEYLGERVQDAGLVGRTYYQGQEAIVRSGDLAHGHVFSPKKEAPRASPSGRILIGGTLEPDEISSLEGRHKKLATRRRSGEEGTISP